MFGNNHDGTFEDISKALGVFEMPPESRRGAAFGDVYNDGNMDILVLNIGQAPSLLINKTPDSNHRVAFHLIGTKSNRAAIGARVTIDAGGVRQFNEVRGGGSYLSQNDLRLHFGLGATDKIVTVEVSWPRGQAELVCDVPADFIYTITEGKGITARVPLPPPLKPSPSASAATENRWFPSNCSSGCRRCRIRSPAREAEIRKHDFAFAGLLACAHDWTRFAATVKQKLYRTVIARLFCLWSRAR